MTTAPPYADEWLALETTTGGRVTLEGDALQIRKQFDEFFAKIQSTLPAPTNDIDTFDAETAEGVIVRVYKPRNLPSGSPTGLYIHSGGWCCGSIEHEDYIAQQLALDVACTLVSVEYRLAPEHPFPAAIEDCTSAWNWMVSNKELATEKYFIVGGSAGGNLCITTTLNLLNSNATAEPKAIFALCPGICVSSAMSSLPADLRQYERPLAYEDSAAINKSVLETCGAAYVGSNDAKHPLISPVFHPDLEALPSVYLTTSDKDPANDEAKMFHHKLTEVGVKSTLKEYDGYPHFFHAFPMLEMTKKFHADLAEAIRRECAV